ncbi:MAG TPA: hypothetical protein VIQ30_19590 [Pseudonocardia sp.]
MSETPTPPRWDPRAANQRRTEAARRLPPMPCGCRDPFTVRHREGRCKWRRRGER